MIFNPILPVFITLPIGAVLLILSFTHKKPFSPKSFVRAGIAITLTLTLMRPMLTGVEVETSSINLDVVFAIDTTLSMAAEDYNGKTPRMTAVKEDVAKIMETLGGARYSIVTYDNYPRVVTPFTSDTMTLKRELSSLMPEDSYFARGSSLNDVKEPLQEVLMSARELQEESEDSRQTILFFIGDGEFTRDGETLENFSNLKPLIDSGYVLGYGTTQGGNMKGSENDYYVDSQGYVQDTSTYPYKRGVSKIDEKVLQALAKDLGVDYLHAETHSVVDGAANTIKNFARDSANISESASDIYFVFMVPLIILLIAEFIMDKRNII